MTKKIERSAENLHQRLQEDIDNCEKRMSDVVQKCEQRLQQAISEATEMRLSETGAIDAMHDRRDQAFIERMQSMESAAIDQVRLIREERQQERSVLTSMLDERTHQLQEQISLLSDRNKEATFTAQQKPDDETVARPSPSRKADDTSESPPANSSPCKDPNGNQPSNVSKMRTEEWDSTAKVPCEGTRHLSPDQNIGCRPSIDTVQYMKRRVPHLLRSLEQQLQEFFLEMSDGTEAVHDIEIPLPYATETKNPLEEADPLPATTSKRNLMDEKARLTDIASQMLCVQKRLIKQKRSH